MELKTRKLPKAKFLTIFSSIMLDVSLHSDHESSRQARDFSNDNHNYDLEADTRSISNQPIIPF